MTVAHFRVHVSEVLAGEWAGTVLTRHGRAVAVLLNEDAYRARLAGLHCARLVRRAGIRELQTELGSMLGLLGTTDVQLGRNNTTLGYLVPPEALRAGTGVPAVRVVVGNIAGGEGKTTLVRELGFELASRGYRVALLDGDPQASLTRSLGLLDGEREAPPHTVEGVLLHDSAASPQLPLPLRAHGVNIWEAGESMDGLSAMPTLAAAGMANLREALDAIEDHHDVVLIDTNPSMTPLLQAVTGAADHMLVPVNTLKGTEQLQRINRLLRAAQLGSRRFGVRLLIPNEMEHTSHDRAVMAVLAERYAAFAPSSPPIAKSVRVKDAYAARRPLREVAPGERVTADFAAVADAVIAAVGLTAPGAAL